MTRLLIEAAGVVAFATNVWANLLIARKRESGWIIRLVSNVFWLAFGIAALSIANILNAVTFAAINIYGLRRWRRERTMRQTTCDDHYRIECRWCRQIVRQCRCCPGSDKEIVRTGLCGICASMLPQSNPIREEQEVRKREELSSENTCLGHAHPEEMVFVLLSRDAAAPAAIRAWAAERIRLGKNVETDAQIVDALAIAETMEVEGRRWVTP